MKPGKKYYIEYRFEDPDNGELDISIEIMKESNDLRQGGDIENRPASPGFDLISKTESIAEFISPLEMGPYRIFIYANDNHNHTASVNIPFFY